VDEIERTIVCSSAPPNVALQPTIAIGPRLATPSLGPIAIASELCC
jgi:hypothetical protein